MVLDGLSTILIIATVIGVAVLSFIAAYYLAKFGFKVKLADWQRAQEKQWQQEMGKGRKEAIAHSRSVLGGKFVEQVVPFLPEFKYDPTEARFIGSPIDFIVFPGLATGEPREIVIVEIKSGRNTRLSPHEARIRQLIENGMVRWELIERQTESEE
ncbi:MAG: Holliday junction resolvase-like protein [Chloroflexota bacterium]